MDIKKIRKAVMASRGLMKSTTDTTIKEIWRNLDEETQDKYLKKVKGDKNVTRIDKRDLQDNTSRTCNPGESPDVPVSVPKR